MIQTLFTQIAGLIIMTYLKSSSACSSFENVWLKHSEGIFENHVENPKFQQKRWEVECGKLFRIKNIVENDEKLNSNEENGIKSSESITMALQDNIELVISVTIFEKKTQMCLKDDMDEGYEKLGSPVSYFGFVQNSYGLKLSNGSEVLRGDLIVRRHASEASSKVKKISILISDGLEEISFASIKLMKHQQPPDLSGIKDMHRKFFLNMKCPVFGLNVKYVNLETIFYNANSYHELKLDLEINGTSAFSVRYFELVEPLGHSTNSSIVYLQNDEKTVQMEANNSADIAKSRHVANFSVTSSFLTYDSNKTRKELESGEIEDSILVICKNSVWANLNFNISEIITKNPKTKNVWEAALVKLPWGRLDVKGNFTGGVIVDKTVTIHFYSSSSVVRVTISVTSHPYSLNIRLDCLDQERNVKMEETFSGYSIILTRSDFWKQDSAFKTVLAITVEDYILEGNLGAKNFKVIFRHLNNFRHFLQSNVADFVKVLDKLKSFSPSEDNISKIRHYFSGYVRIMTLDTEFMSKVNHFNSLASQAARALMDALKGAKIDLQFQDILMIFRRSGGSFEESEDDIQISFNSGVAANFLNAIYEEILNQSCPEKEKNKKTLLREIIQQFWSFTLQSFTTSF